MLVFFVKEYPASEWLIWCWSSDVYSSDICDHVGAIDHLAIALVAALAEAARDVNQLAHGHFCDAGDELAEEGDAVPMRVVHPLVIDLAAIVGGDVQKRHLVHDGRSEEHTSELQSLMRISYAVFCLKKKNTRQY